MTGNVGFRSSTPGWPARPPTLKQLGDFARKTHTPVGFLSLDEPPIEAIPIPDFRPVGAGAVVSAELLDVIYACERRQEWYRDNQILEGEAPLPFVGVATTDDSAEATADQMREVLDWTAQSRATCRKVDAALTWLREHAEAAGVLVMISGIVGSNTHRKLDPQELAEFVGPMVGSGLKRGPPSTGWRAGSAF